MSTSEKSPPPPDNRPISKATMDEPQEEFIADAPNAIESHQEVKPRKGEQSATSDSPPDDQTQGV